MTDIQTNRQISIGRGLALPVPPLTMLGSSPAGRAVGSLPVWSQSWPVSPFLWLHELQPESGGPTGPGT